MERSAVNMSKDIPTLYGSLVFSDKVMRNKLPKDVYKALRKTIENGTHLELDVANSVAVAMKEWVVQQFIADRHCFRFMLSIECIL